MEERKEGGRSFNNWQVGGLAGVIGFVLGALGYRTYL
jgi:hypothetical protein